MGLHVLALRGRRGSVVVLSLVLHVSVSVSSSCLYIIIIFIYLNINININIFYFIGCYFEGLCWCIGYYCPCSLCCSYCLCSLCLYCYHGLCCPYCLYCCHGPFGLCPCGLCIIIIRYYYCRNYWMVCYSYLIIIKVIIMVVVMVDYRWWNLGGLGACY